MKRFYAPFSIKFYEKRMRGGKPHLRHLLTSKPGVPAVVHRSGSVDFAVVYDAKGQAVHNPTVGRYGTWSEIKMTSTFLLLGDTVRFDTFQINGCPGVEIVE